MTTALDQGVDVSALMTLSDALVAVNRQACASTDWDECATWYRLLRVLEAELQHTNNLLAAKLDAMLRARP